MSMIATAVKHLLAAGVGGDELVRAIAEMEAAMPAPVDPVAEKRRAYDRDRKRNAKNNSTGIPPESAETAEQENKRNSPTPPKENTPPQISPKGDTTPQAANDEVPLTPEHIVEAWNDMATRTGLAKVRKLSPQRKRGLSARIRQFTVDEFTEAIDAIERSPFLRGESGRDSWGGATIEWLCSEKKMIQLMEGQYDKSTDRQTCRR